MSKIDKSGLYMILNEGSSPVYVPGRNGGFMLDGGTASHPAMRQLYFSEIVEINSVSDLFRNGHLFFEPEYADAMYEELRIPSPENILHNADIEDILLHPSIEGLQRILDIRSATYFDRVRGVYVGLKNSNADLGQNVIKLMEARTQEVANGIMTTKISVAPKRSQSEINAEQMDAMRKELEALKAKIDEPKEKDVVEKAPVQEEVTVPVKKNTASAQKKSASTATKKKNTSKK